MTVKETNYRSIVNSEANVFFLKSEHHFLWPKKIFKDVFDFAGLDSDKIRIEIFRKIALKSECCDEGINADNDHKLVYPSIYVFLNEIKKYHS